LTIFAKTFVVAAAGDRVNWI